MSTPSFASGVDWGNVPAWTGSILTGGSLLLGFYILLRDRRKADRFQAERVTYWEQQFRNVSQPERRYAIRVGIRNASDRPIYQPYLLVRPKAEKAIRRLGKQDAEALQRIKAIGKAGGAEFERYSPWLTIDGRLSFSADSMRTTSSNPLDRSELLAGENTIFQIDIVYPYQWLTFEVCFRDSSNVAWRRDVLSNKLRRDWPQGKQPALFYSFPALPYRLIYRMIPRRFVNARHNFIDWVSK